MRSAGSEHQLHATGERLNIVTGCNSANTGRRRCGSHTHRYLELSVHLLLSRTGLLVSTNDKQRATRPWQQQPHATEMFDTFHPVMHMSTYAGSDFHAHVTEGCSPFVSSTRAQYQVHVGQTKPGGTFHTPTEKDHPQHTFKQNFICQPAIQTTKNARAQRSINCLVPPTKVAVCCVWKHNRFCVTVSNYTTGKRHRLTGHPDNMWSQPSAKLAPKSLHNEDIKYIPWFTIYA